jgi:hypothetical protein
MQTVSRIFWPSHLNAFNRALLYHSGDCADDNLYPSATPSSASELPARTGYLIGWNVRSLICCVATVVFAPSEASLPLSSLEAALHTVSTDPACSELWRYCGGAPCVLGQWRTEAKNSSGSGVGEATREEVERRKRNVWVRLMFSALP